MRSDTPVGRGSKLWLSRLAWRQAPDSGPSGLTSFDGHPRSGPQPGTDVHNGDDGRARSPRRRRSFAPKVQGRGRRAGPEALAGSSASGGHVRRVHGPRARRCGGPEGAARGHPYRHVRSQPSRRLVAGGETRERGRRSVAARCDRFCESLGLSGGVPHDDPSPGGRGIVRSEASGGGRQNVALRSSQVNGSRCPTPALRHRGRTAPSFVRGAACQWAQSCPRRCSLTAAATRSRSLASTDTERCGVSPPFRGADAPGPECTLTSYFAVLGGHYANTPPLVVGRTISLSPPNTILRTGDGDR